MNVGQYGDFSRAKKASCRLFSLMEVRVIQVLFLFFGTQSLKFVHFSAGIYYAILCHAHFVFFAGASVCQPIMAKSVESPWW